MWERESPAPGRGAAWCRTRWTQKNAEQGLVQVSLETNGDEVILAVEDQGSGVPESEQHQIFEPFYTTKPEGMGTGLGLSISQQIVQDHGGHIVVGKASLGGARFEMRLPLDREANS